jgi:hypothetical protein
VADRVERVHAAERYIARGLEKIREARALRDADLRALVAEHGASQTARLAGLSLSTVKLVKGRP